MLFVYNKVDFKPKRKDAFSAPPGYGVLIAV